MRTYYDTIKGKAWESVCALILPLTTNCKVCNVLRGMGIGFCLGMIAGIAALRATIAIMGA